MAINGLALQDLHFGIKDSQRLYDELSLVKEYLYSTDKVIHIININGDFFDRKLSLNEPAAFLAMMFFDEIVQICKKMKIKLRVLQGTRSHDFNQLTIFSHYLSDTDLDLKIIQTVTEENLFGYNFLYVPEEYPENEKEFYEKYKKSSYKVINGHGTWDFVAFDEQIIASQVVGVNSAPVFLFNEWKDALKDGVAIFGHIHGRNVYGKKVFYSGSFTRWGFGEESERGFTVYSIDPLDDSVNVEFVNNKYAPKFNSISLKKLLSSKDMENKTSDEIAKIIEKQVIKGLDNIKVDITGLSADKILLLKKAFEGSESIRIETKEKKTLLTENESDDLSYNKYSYILNRELPLDETIKRFAKDEFEKELNLDDIRKILLEK